MPRTKSQPRNALVDSALAEFWKNGYHVVSIGDLVRETGVSRAGIYADYSGKEELFHACLERYQETVVSSVFHPVEEKGAGLEAIGRYFSNLIAAVEQFDGPCPGCLVVNTLAQLEPEETQTRQLLEQHVDRITNGFRKAISNENKKRGGSLKKKDIDGLAEFITISVQGLSSYFRATTETKQVQAYVNTLMRILEVQLSQ